MNGLGLNVTGFSYRGTLWVCAVACREMMPDPGFFADCMRAAFADLVAAADRPPADAGRGAGTGSRSCRPQAKSQAKPQAKAKARLRRRRARAS
jgi:hypothetical protein